jgi:biotin synthase-like enzyme
MKSRLKKLKQKLVKEYFQELDAIENECFDRVRALERFMQNETGIKDLEFFYSDGCIVGIGTPTREKKLKLIHR